jgi:hypothetical protein
MTTNATMRTAARRAPPGTAGHSLRISRISALPSVRSGGALESVWQRRFFVRAPSAVPQLSRSNAASAAEGRRLSIATHSRHLRHKSPARSAFRSRRFSREPSILGFAPRFKRRSRFAAAAQHRRVAIPRKISRGSELQLRHKSPARSAFRSRCLSREPSILRFSPRCECRHWRFLAARLLPAFGFLSQEVSKSRASYPSIDVEQNTSQLAENNQSRYALSVNFSRSRNATKPVAFAFTCAPSSPFAQGRVVEAVASLAKSRIPPRSAPHG